jgi:hypothetical protein
MKAKLQFITCDRVKDSYGITSGLFNSANFVVRFLKEQGYAADLTPVQDANSIDRVVTQANPDIVVLEALWVPPAKLAELVALPRHSKRKWIIRVHSKAPFLANEGLATRWIQQYTSIESDRIIIAPNTRELSEQLSEALPYGNFICLPNIYNPPAFKPTRQTRNKHHIDIGCFGAIRPMKNTYQQALAAISFAESRNLQLFFHVNASRVEQKGDNVLKNLVALFDYSPHRLVQHGWYQHRDFLLCAEKMDLAMQVSFSESFNIVSADCVTAGVPTVVSDDIEWMPKILQTSPTSHRGMIKKLQRAWRWRGLATRLQRLYLAIYNIKAKLAWLRWINLK